MRRSLRLTAVVFVTPFAGCGSGTARTETPVCSRTAPEWGPGGDLMLPGTDCLGCHRAGGKAAAHPYSVAGTVFATTTCAEGVGGVLIHVRDADAGAITLTTNDAGNFFTAEALRPPFRVSVEVDGGITEMRSPVSNGSCNACHSPEAGMGWLGAR